MNLTISFVVVAGIAITWYIVSGIMIINELLKRKQKINFVFIKLMQPVYAHRYKKITLEETGKVGTLFYHWLVSVNIALIFGIAAIMSKVV